MLFRTNKLNTGVVLHENDVADIQTTVEGLSKLFSKFLYKYPTTSADTILTLLITHLRHHYERPMILEHICAIRLVVRFIE